MMPVVCIPFTSGPTMKHLPLLLLTVWFVGCDARSGSDTLVHGMTWSIAQRDLEQNGWVSTEARPGRFLVSDGGRAYRYRNTGDETVDIITERIGDSERIDRIFDINGKEMPALAPKVPRGR